MSKWLFWLERVVDWSIGIALFFALNLLLSSYWPLLVWFMTFLVVFVFLKRTPAMALFKRKFFTKPTLWKCIKIFIGLGQKETNAKQCRKIRCLFGLLVGCLSAVFIFFSISLAEFAAEFEEYQQTLGWNYYRSQERGFVIQFPTEPVAQAGQLYIEEAGKAFSFNEYKSFDSSGAYYTVSYIDFPSRWRLAGSGRLLSTALDLLIKSEEGVELTSQVSVQHRNWPAIDFEVKKDQEIRQGRLILIDNTFYKVMRVSPLGASEDPHFEEFLHSFLFPKN